MTEEQDRPVIGIPCEAVRDREWWPPAYGHRQTYLAAILAAGGLPLLIPMVEEEAILRDYYARLDGLLLAGGKDVGPSHYAEEPHENLDTVDPVQDYVECYLTRRALADGLPLLAICRGIQVLNVAMGGTLYQDIPTQYATPLDHEASTHHAKAHRHGEWTWRGHDMRLSEDSLLASWLGTTHLAVNSLHHQAIKQMAKGLRAVGWSSDGLVEAVEGEGGAFLVGVQCHPEALQAGTDERWQAVFRAFVKRCATRDR
jgi:putative glutamine amidotransferase